MLRSHGAERIFDQLKIRAFSNPVPKAFSLPFSNEKNPGDGFGAFRCSVHTEAL